MTVYAITDTKKGEQGLHLLIFKLPHIRIKTDHSLLVPLFVDPAYWYFLCLDNVNVVTAPSLNSFRARLQRGTHAMTVC